MAIKMPVNYNGKKSNVISVLKRKNGALAKAIMEMDKSDLDELQRSMLGKLADNLRRCSCPSLYAQGLDGKDTRYIGSVRCDSKSCFVCNYARQKQVRRKYWAWFADNREVYLVQEEGKAAKYVTKTQYNEKYKDERILQRVEYDLMHLTLSVPHYPGTGFCGHKYYFEDIAKLYNRIRNKNEYFKAHVIGGEYGIETTNPENLHIHIHSLLLVKRERRNRNKLHFELLKAWNRLTVNPENPRTEIPREVWPKIAAGNEMIDEAYIRALNPKGATLIGLETIYTKDPQSGQKVRSYEWNSKAMLRAVMETISYHFSPTAFDKKDKTFNLELLAELLPVIHGKQLYRKFGCLHGEKSLNVRTSESDEDEFDQQVYVDDATGEVVDTETGEVIDRVRQFFVTSPAYVFHDPNADYAIHLSREGQRKRRWLAAHTTREAVNELRREIRERYQKQK